MATLYTHFLFVATKFNPDQSVKQQLIFDDSKESQQSEIPREMNFHHHQNFLRKKRLKIKPQFHAMNHEHEILADSDFKNGTVFYDFKAFIKAVKHLS